jgi:prephenate dehydratase
VIGDSSASEDIIGERIVKIEQLIDNIEIQVCNTILSHPFFLQKCFQMIKKPLLFDSKTLIGNGVR